MRKHFWWIGCVFLMLSISVISWKPVSEEKPANKPEITNKAKELFSQYVASVYQTAKLQESGLDLEVFQKALMGYLNLKAADKLQNSSVITIVDLAKSSCQKRMWIIDILSKQLLLNTWVAHGQGSGEDMATQFSNTDDSHQSSLGFYLTDDVYIGKHGRSLRLDGLDEGFNSNARMRDIVVHGADYVGPGAINEMGRLGRSFGCPAVPPGVIDLVINTIKGKTVLFINGNDPSYTSKYLDENVLADFNPADTTAAVDPSKI
jgi:hypothetical protein